MELYRRDILDKFIQNTGARADSAQDILNRCNWDYHSAIQMFSPTHHPQTGQCSSYGYPPNATVRHVPIIYVGSTNQTQELQRPASQTNNTTNMTGTSYGCPSGNRASNVTGNHHGERVLTGNHMQHPVNNSGQGQPIRIDHSQSHLNPGINAVNRQQSHGVSNAGGTYYGSYNGGNKTQRGGANIGVNSYNVSQHNPRTQGLNLQQQQTNIVDLRKPANVNNYAGATVRPVQITNHVPHIVTTPTATRPTPTTQPTMIHPSRNVPISSTASSRPVTSSLGPSENVRPVSSIHSTSAPKTQFVPDNQVGLRVSLPASPTIPFNGGKTETRQVSQNPSTGSSFVSVTPVNTQHIDRLSSNSSPVCTMTSHPVAQDPVTQKAPLIRSNATDIDCEDGVSRILKRGISKTSDNLPLVTKARDVVLHDIRESSEDHMQYFVDTPELTFILPDLTIYSEDYRGFLEKDLIETSTLISLEQAGCLNWWADVGICQRLHPMATTGDGNCLLHAASLAMWGFHDRDLILRKALYNSMTSGAFHGALFRQWRYQQTLVNKQTGLIYCEDEWRKEWENLLRLASTEPRRSNFDRNRENSCCGSPLTQESSSCRHSTVVYESLEEFHVFVLAHVLRRPIVVVADKVLRDTNGEALAPIPFGGIYLPMGCRAEKCHHTPLLLTYDAAHFSALVPMKRERAAEENHSLPVAMPILDCQYDLLPLHFVIDPGEHFDWSKLDNNENPSCSELTISQKFDLIERYMNLVKLPFTKFEDNDSDQRSNGSVDSDESVGSGGKEKRKDTKLHQQMHSVSKQFGSLGRSMGKKFKKNFGNIGKSKGKSENGSKNSTVASGVTQSTKLMASIPMLFDQEQVILCAQLSAYRSDIQEQLVKNYLTEAKKRFETDRDLKRQKGVELKTRLPLDKPVGKGIDKLSVKCVTPNCSMYGTPSNSYLCSDCYARSKKLALQQVNSTPSQFVYNTYPGPRSQTAPIGSDSMYRMECGKSKFYAPVAVEEAVDLRNPGKSSLIPAVNNIAINRPKSAGVVETRSVPAGSMLIQRPVSNVTRINLIDDSATTEQQLLPRTPSPDCHYDNVEYNGNKADSEKTAPHKECRSPGCNFFGREATDNYCSKCFKDRQTVPLVQVDLLKTRL